jgi:precorrin-3B synthase
LPTAPAQALRPGATALGTVFGAAFGQIEASALAALVQATQADAIRVTPWRLFLLEGVEPVETADFITEFSDPLLSIDACPGAPLCTSSSVETRPLARALAATARGALHVSGCAKGCARPRPCATTLVGNNGAFDLVKNGRPWDAPTKTGLTPDQLTTALGEF